MGATVGKGNSEDDTKENTGELVHHKKKCKVHNLEFLTIK